MAGVDRGILPPGGSEGRIPPGGSLCCVAGYITCVFSLIPCVLGAHAQYDFLHIQLNNTHLEFLSHSEVHVCIITILRKKKIGV